MATFQVKDLVLRSPAGSTEVVSFTWPLQVGTGQDKHDNGIDIIDTIKFVCDELPSISSAFEEVNLNHVDTACYKTMTNIVDRFNKAVDSIVALEKGTSLPAERLNKFAHPSLLRHILQLVYNAAVLDPDKLNNYEPFSPEVYGETSYELVQQMIKHVTVSTDDTFIDLGSGVGQVVLQMAGSFPLKTCIGIEKADTPAIYAERMDLYFRQFMAWFGKRYCEYQLIKGDFLLSEHREKITSSTLVFVNNFAFGPNVDHQLKERFADLRDGARIVSSKSFCPLNFRITDRNLSDIGTIMHLSEIPPLKGSVSWTCKPVSYYLHVIDRTILERYFQRMKTAKSVGDHDHIGSTRTTRDRAKREAHHNNNNTITVRRNTTTNDYDYNYNNNTIAVHQTNGAINGLKSRATPQLTQQQDTSTESDGEAGNSGGGNSTTTNATINGCGPMTRKGWSDWLSPKCDKSSQSDDEENNNNYNNARTAARTTVGVNKKRKKLTRKAAIASKSANAAAAQRENNNTLGKENNKEDCNGVVAAQNARGRKGRIKKGGRGRKSLKIAGLDVLHKETLLSTSVETLSKKLPPAPGCVDQQLTSLLTGDMSHTELDIPKAPQDTPYALQILLDVFRTQYMNMIEQMKTPQYLLQIKRQIQIQEEHKQRLKYRALQLDKQISVLVHDSVALLKERINELGINLSSPEELIVKAKELVGRHRELQTMVKRIQLQVNTCELEQRQLLKEKMQNLTINRGNEMKIKVDCNDLSETEAHELVLREIATTLSERKKLYAQVAILQTETLGLEQTVQERRTSTSLPQQQQQQQQQGKISSAVTSVICATNATVDINSSITPTTTTIINQPLQLTTNNNAVKYTANNLVPNTLNATTSAAKFTKSPRRQHSREPRDVRLRAQEWPDVPDVGKIEESNPEVLAQKILETGRQIEAGKFVPTINNNNNNNNNIKQTQLDDKTIRAVNLNGNILKNNNLLHKRSLSNERLSVSQATNPTIYATVHTVDNSLMPAPTLRNQQQQQQQQQQQVQQQQQQQQSARGQLLPKCKESPKVANFEHRLKSIITSVLNEDQEHRKQQQQTHSNVLLPEQQQQQQPTTPTSTTPTKRKPATTLQQQQQQQQSCIMQLNANTTISAIVPTTTATTNNNNKLTTNNYATKYATTKDANKYHMQQQQQPTPAHLSHMYTANMAIHRRRPSVSAASFEHFAAQQQQQHNPQQEFKAPNMSRATSREHLADLELRPVRSNSAHADYYERITNLQATSNNNLQERCNSRELEAITTPPMQIHPPSRPNSNSSQPDYTQVSPAKIALRRHLSQEKLNQMLNSNINATPTTTLNTIVAPLSTKTIGDLVNGEIERTLEISNQSIINAVVNKSSVAIQNATANNSNNNVAPMPLNSIYSMERERLPLHERLLINPNVQRPERVNVRILDEQQQQQQQQPTTTIKTSTTPPPITTSNNTPHGNLNTLAHVAYNHKLMQAQQQQQQQLQQQQQQQQTHLTNGRQYQTVFLPRAEMKGCIEAYFNEEHLHGQVATPHEQHQTSPIKEHKSIKEQRNISRNQRSNQPLEGLAASLQDHMLASRKFKEEHDERQRRSIVTNNVEASSTNHYNHYATQHAVVNGSAHHKVTSPVKVEAVGVKRTSPMPHNQPRAAKLQPFVHDNNLTQQYQQHAAHQQQIYATQQQRQQLLPPRKKLSVMEPLLMNPEINSVMSEERLQYQQHQQQQQQQQLYHHATQKPQLTNAAAQHNTLILQQFHPHSQQAPATNNRNTPIGVGGRNGDDGKNSLDPNNYSKFPKSYVANSTNSATITSALSS